MCQKHHSYAEKKNASHKYYYSLKASKAALFFVDHNGMNPRWRQTGLKGNTKYLEDGPPLSKWLVKGV